jgi:N-acyl-D-amino-acid deacylase
MTSVLIKGGSVYDGSGRPPEVLDVLVRDGRIAALGHLDADADRILSAEGLAVCPGFIDIHSHSDCTALADPRCVSAIRQGVTTELVGNCGFGAFPVRDPALGRHAVYGFDAEDNSFCDTAGAYLDLVDKARPGVNIATLVPNGQVRMNAAGLVSRPLDSDETRMAQRLIAESLSEGAFGLSTGLEYPAEQAAGTEELVRMCQCVRPFGGYYATHTRHRDSQSTAAVREAIETARRADVRLQISHLLPRNMAQEGLACIDVTDEAIARGQPINFDMHTRTFGIASITAIMPAELAAMPEDAKRAAFGSGEAERMIRGSRSMFTEARWDAITLLGKSVPDAFAKRLMSDVARDMGTDPVGAVIQLIARDPLEAGQIYLLRHLYVEDDLLQAFSHPNCMPGSDATTLTPAGKQSACFFHGAFSWAAWYVRTMWKQRRVHSLEETIRRVTSLPAAIIGLPDRGTLREGLAADICVFDPDTISEAATIFEPNQEAIGVRHLLVNGAVTIADGEITGARGGRALRRH